MWLSPGRGPRFPQRKQKALTGGCSGQYPFPKTRRWAKDAAQTPTPTAKTQDHHPRAMIAQVWRLALGPKIPALGPHACYKGAGLQGLVLRGSGFGCWLPLRYLGSGSTCAPLRLLNRQGPAPQNPPHTKNKVPKRLRCTHRRQQAVVRVCRRSVSHLLFTRAPFQVLRLPWRIGVEV